MEGFQAGLVAAGLAVVDSEAVDSAVEVAVGEATAAADWAAEGLAAAGSAVADSAAADWEAATAAVGSVEGSAEATPAGLAAMEEAQHAQIAQNRAAPVAEVAETPKPAAADNAIVNLPIGSKARGGDIDGQHPAERPRQGHALGAHRRDLGQHPRAGVLDAQQPHAARQSPEAPPCFSSRRTASITMPRSAALSMS